ncbi:MAG: hypothetical protein PQJ58_10655 [Spirochaetales bacterium]|nr:hypothetical protein [Spirochaetales bacterium]
MKHFKTVIAVFLILSSVSLFSCRKPSVDLNGDVEDQGISSFYLKSSINPGLDGDLEADIRGSVIYFSLPDTVNRSSLIPSFDFQGKGLQVDGLWQDSGNSSHDFTSPVYYDLVKTDNSRIQYTVIAGYGDIESSSLYHFEFNTGMNPGLDSTVSAEINNDTIIFNFPFESTVGTFIPTFFLSGGGTVSYNGIILVSDAAPMINPASGGTLRVDFDDGTTRNYRVVCTVAEQKYIHVANSGSAGASGSQSNPLDTIEEAVSMAESKGIREIRLASGAYYLSTNLYIRNNISIKGGYSSFDWNYRDYDNPGSRSGTLCEISINAGNGTAGTADEHMGSIIYEGSSVGPDTVLEGVRVYGSSDGIYTAAVTVLDGAAPTIQYSDLYGASVSDSSALSVYNASPRIYSSQLIADASNYSVGLNIGYDAEPTVVSSRITASNTFSSATGIAMQTAGGGAGGFFYNNFFDGHGTTQGVAVRLGEPGGTFINNIFAVGSGMPGDICFWEDGSGNRPDILEHNNFSTDNIGVPLYKKDGSTDIDNAEDINALGYASASGNSDFRFNNYFNYESAVWNNNLPVPVAYEGTALTGIWSYDLYNGTHNDSSGWSMGPIELDNTNLAGEVIFVDDPFSDDYLGDWSSINIREALVIVNSGEEAKGILLPAGTYTLNLSYPLEITSDVFISGADGDITYNGNGSDPHIIVDDGNGSPDLEVFIESITFTGGGNAGNPVGGSIVNREKLLIYDCLFSSNNAVLGGAVYSEGSELYIANTIFDLNTANSGLGGAIYGIDSSLAGINMVFTGNQTNGSSTAHGGAIYLEDSVGVITFSSFSTNSTEGSGAVYGESSDVQVLSSIFVNNIATNGFDDIQVAGAADFSRTIVQDAVHVNHPDTIIGPPGVASTANPGGADTLWKTPDDNLHAASNGELMYDFGWESHLVSDWPDADDDGDTDEDFPYDIKGVARVQDTAPEAGAYEGVHVP